MRYFEAECLDGNNLVGYGRFNPDHITAVEQFKTMEKKWNTYRECINQILQLLLNGKSFVCLRDIYQIFLAHLRILKNLMKKNYLLKTKTYFFYIIYTFILILNRVCLLQKDAIKLWLKSLGYDVQFVHVKCRVSGTGHIRLRLKHSKNTGGNWINRDPAAVADTTSGNVRTIWCEDGYLIAYDPCWIFTDLYSS